MDVTDQRQREKEIADARRMLADAIESLSEGFALYDEDDKLVMCNSSYREMNAGVADILEPGLTWSELLHESARRGIYADAIGQEESWVNERLESGFAFMVLLAAVFTNNKSKTPGSVMYRRQAC